MEQEKNRRGLRRRKKEKDTPVQREISFRRLVAESLPEMWLFQFVTKLLLIFFARLLRKINTAVIGTRAAAITTANLKSVLFSWQGLVFFIIGVCIILLYIVFELFAQILFSENILKGRQEKGLFRNIFVTLKRGFLAVPKFLNLSGIPILIYIFIAVPLVGLGFSISLTKSFHIPNFIMEVIQGKPLYSVLYAAGIITLLVLGIRSIFCVHGVLIGGLSPNEARVQSVYIIKKHWKDFFRRIIGVFAALILIRFAAYCLFVLVPDTVLLVRDADLPQNYYFDPFSVGEDGISELDLRVLGYRFGSAFAILEGSYLYSVVRMLTMAYLMLRFTRFYLDYTKEPEEETVYLSRPQRYHYFTQMPVAFIIAIAMAVASLAVAVGYNIVDDNEPVKIVAHRTGGYLASENSIEGIEQAIAHGCYGSETDVQRTKDGYYIINHDNDFKRLTGVNKKPSELTLAEIKELRIADTTGNGEFLEVPTIEELLDASKGRIKLFIELKGATADRQMVDDIVRIVREKDCMNDVALISLNYDIIDYAETNYPEFETGVLFFAAYGDLTRMNCDVLAIEEEAATNERVGLLHYAGKQAFVWTVNTEESMENVLDSRVDAVITDDILLAERTQEALDARSEFEVIQSWFANVWE